jgi:hypothetical protein
MAFYRRDRDFLRAPVFDWVADDSERSPFDGFRRTNSHIFSPAIPPGAVSL